MSQQNLEIVRRCIECLNRRDLPQLIELLDPDVEIDLSRNIFNPHVFRGHSSLERVRSRIEDVWDDFHGVPDELVDVGDNVVTALTMRAKGRQSGVDVQMQIFQVWTLRDSKVVRVVGGFRTRSEAVEAAGLA